MVTQKAISLKIDTKLLQELDREASLGILKRNGHINRAIKCYLSLQDAKRMAKCYQEPSIKRRVLEEWLREWFPGVAYRP